MKKLLLIVLSVLVVLVAGVGLFKNVIAKAVLTAGVKAVTGLNMTIEKLDIGVLNTLIDVEDVKITNPDNFSDKDMVDLPELYIDYELIPFLTQRKVHLKELRLNLKELVVVKNKEGQLNLDSLKVVQEKKEEPKDKVQEKDKASMPEFRIDLFKLKIGRVVYRDYSKSGTPSVKEYNININQKYENITDVKALASLILVKALANTTLGQLINFDLGPFQQEISQMVGGALGKTKELTTQVSGQVTEGAQEAVQTTKEAAGELLNNTGDTLKKLNPFGK